MSNAPIQSPIVSQSGLPTREWIAFFSTIGRFLLNKTPTPSASFSVSSVPDATLYTGNIIFVSDESGGATIAFSDGTNWRRAQDRAIIS